MNKELITFLFTGLNARDQLIFAETDKIESKLHDSIMEILDKDLNAGVALDQKELNRLSDKINSLLVDAIDTAVTKTIDETCNILGFGRPFADSASLYGDTIYKINLDFLNE